MSDYPAIDEHIQRRNSAVQVERDQLKAELARVTAERDALTEEFRRNNMRYVKLLWLAEKHIPPHAVAAYYAAKNDAFPVVPIGSPEASS